MRFLFSLLCVGALALGGCLTPSSGPQATMIYAGAGGDGARPTYELIEFDPSFLNLLKFRAHDTLVGHFKDGRSGPGHVKIGIGDVIGISVYEASAGGLFTPAATDTLRQGNFVALPNQIVDQDGTISVPFAGRIPANGKSTRQIENEIIGRLKDRAIEPQIVVSIVDSRSSVYSVMGDVQTGGRFQINWVGDRLLAGISRAGGPRSPDFETSVTLTRGGKTATAMLQTVIRNPREDIFLRPGDEVYLRREPRFFTALGAAGRSGHYPIEVPRLTVAEAIGRAQGLLDTQADPTGAFLFRWENAKVLTELGRDVSGYDSTRIPTIYHLDLQNPTHLLATQQMDILDKDVVYITNAPTVETRKALQVLADMSYITFNSASVSVLLGPR